jgi:hypothetical protein
VEVGKSISPTLDEKIGNYIRDYYSHLHPNAEDTSKYEQEMLTNVKHKLSKETGTLYWHLVLDSKNTQVSFLEEMDYRFVYRIQGPKTDKYIYAYSQKGINNPVMKIVQTKWKQILTFVVLFALLLTVAMCPEGNAEKSAYCANKSTIFYVIGGFFMLMVGMKIASRKKRKLPGEKPKVESKETNKETKE